MRRAVAAVVAGAAVLFASASSAVAQEPYPWDHRVESAGTFAKNRLGRVSFAVVSPDGRVRGRNIHATYRSASVVKAMLMVAYLNERGIRGRRLRRTDKSLLRPMVTRSDNRAASRVQNIVGNDALAKLARRVRMKDFATSPSWGATRISAHDQARFFWRVPAYVPSRHRGYARTLLANVVRDQRWGLPPALPDGWRLYFKGGWLPPRLVHQVGLFERGRTRVAIAVLTDGDPSFRYGQRTIAEVAKRLLLRVNDFAL